MLAVFKLLNYPVLILLLFWSKSRSNVPVPLAFSYVIFLFFVGSSEPLCSLVAEDRIVFGLNALAMSPLTLAKIRKVYRKTDSKAIAKQLGMSSHENATPIRLLHNAGGHLSGPARTLGGVVIGYLGVRVFCPRPVCTTIQAVGGCSVLLGT
jgi:WD repeat and FYVE domain-containing protein 3